MGVMACDRNGCTHIMCHLMVRSRVKGYERYICVDCHTELERLVARLDERTPPTDVEDAIDAFFATEHREALPEAVKTPRQVLQHLTRNLDDG